MNKTFELKKMSVYQSDLIFACLEGICAMECLGSLYTGKLEVRRKEWKKSAADFVFINLSVGFFEMNELSEYGDVKATATPSEISELLMTSDSEKDVVVWMGVRYFSTEKLSEILERHGMLNWAGFQAERLPAFIDEISLIYKDWGIKTGNEIPWEC